MKSEVKSKVDFSKIRYSQCWEDADILLEALEINSDDRCMSIAAAGENVFAIASKSPKEVIAIDLNKTQLYLVELKIALYKNFDYKMFLEFLGVKRAYNRKEMFEIIKKDLSEEALEYWEENIELIEEGVVHIGKFENFFRIFRTKILKLIHSKKRIEKLLESKSKEERSLYFDKKWNNWRWRILFKLFFSSYVVGKLGRDPRFFDYAEKSLSSEMFERVKYAFTELDVSKNSYVEYILTGEYKRALPYALREENFESIKKNISKIKLVNETIEEYMSKHKEKVTKYNLSDIFEYMSQENMDSLVEFIIKNSESSSKMAYWNLIVYRQSSEKYSDKIELKKDLSKELHLKDKAFFYTNFIVEEIK